MIYSDALPQPPPSCVSLRRGGAVLLRPWPFMLRSSVVGYIKCLVEETLRSSVCSVLVGGMNAVLAVLSIVRRTAYYGSFVRQVLLLCEYWIRTLASIFAESNSCIANRTISSSRMTRFRRRTYDACPCQSQHLAGCTGDSNVSDCSAKRATTVSWI